MVRRRWLVGGGIVGMVGSMAAPSALGVLRDAGFGLGLLAFVIGMLRTSNESDDDGDTSIGPSSSASRDDRDGCRQDDGGCDAGGGGDSGGGDGGGD